MDQISDSSDSDNEIEDLILLYCISKRREKSLWRSDFMKKRKTHGEFKLTSEFDDITFKKYTRFTRDQCAHIHSLIEGDIFREGCNCQRAISTQEKLTIFLR